MSTQHIPGATVGDIEAALIEQYGRNNVRERSKSSTRGEWTFRITSKSQGKCIAVADAVGASLSMSPSTHMLMWVVTALGYLAFVFPGVAFTAFILLTRFVTARVISSRFPKMVDNVKRIASGRIQTWTAEPVLDAI
jgi:hypothetical protein